MSLKLTSTQAVLLLLAGLMSVAEVQAGHEPHFTPVQVVRAQITGYPPFSTASGTVVLCVTVEASGKPGGIDVVAGIPQLSAEAQRSVRQWQFEPARIAGRAVAAPLIATFTFISPNRDLVEAQRRPVVYKQSSGYIPVRILSVAPIEYRTPAVAFSASILKVTVNARGAPEEVEVIDGLPSLNREAEQSLSHWRFAPAILNGLPASTTLIASFIFSDAPIERCP